MKRGSTIFLRCVLFLIAIVALMGLIWFPQTEGRAVGLDLVSIYSDPLIIYTYIGSIPFFIALYYAYTLLGYVDSNKIFSHAAVRAVRNIKYSAIAVVGFLVAAIFYIRVMVQGDDASGPTMLGFVTTFTAIVIAVVAAISQRLLSHAVDIQSENDLTV
jgi:protein-S-isoprenylcysteine O-methyltransferase Ste14